MARKKNDPRVDEEGLDRLFEVLEPAMKTQSKSHQGTFEAEADYVLEFAKLAYKKNTDTQIKSSAGILINEAIKAKRTPTLLHAYFLGAGYQELYHGLGPEGAVYKEYVDRRKKSKQMTSASHKEKAPDRLERNIEVVTRLIELIRTTSPNDDDTVATEILKEFGIAAYEKEEKYLALKNPSYIKGKFCSIAHKSTNDPSTLFQYFKSDITDLDNDYDMTEACDQLYAGALKIYGSDRITYPPAPRVPDQDIRAAYVQVFGQEPTEP